MNAAPVSGFCGGDNPQHQMCTGNLQIDNGDWVYCQCPLLSCPCNYNAIEESSR